MIADSNSQITRLEKSLFFNDYH